VAEAQVLNGEETLQRSEGRVLPYEQWKKDEGLPSYHGFWIENLYDLELTPWESRGGTGAFVNLEGTCGFNDAYVYELAPKESSNPIRHIYEETVFLLKGQGATTVWIDGKSKQTFEWRERSFFSIPINAYHQYHNLSGTEPARFVAITAAPRVINSFRNREFVFENPFVFRELYDGEASYFQETEPPVGRRAWNTNYVGDVMARGPVAVIGEGEDRPRTTRMSTGFVSVNQSLSFSMVNSTIAAHSSSWPTGTYKPSHRHGPGIHIVILAGQGYTLMWQEGLPVQRYDWKPGSLLVPPDGWFHQHFNAGAEPVMFLAIGSENDAPRPSGQPYYIFRSTKDGGDRIFYEDEDPAIHSDFEAALAKVGVACNMGKIHPFCTQT
jgi:quercetin dioxygenase-like cupin family protein